MTIAIIADDLTGANDSGLQFASYGLLTKVFLGDPPEALVRGVPVAVIDTETRGLEAAEVERTIAAVAARVRAIGAEQVYKKLDSTLRGHVGLELFGTAKALGSRLVLVTPAYPAMKRTVENGQLLVDGVSVDKTAIGRDPGSPVKTGDIAALIAPHMPGVRCLNVSLADLAQPDALIARLGAAMQEETVCAIFDAAADADLVAIAAFGVRAASRLQVKPLWAGSAGLAAKLPTAWGLATKPPAPPALEAASRPPLLVVGSVNPVSVAQTDAAMAEICANPVSLSPDLLLGDAAMRGAEIARGAEALRANIAAGSPTLILTTAHAPADVDRVVALAASLGLTRGQAGRKIATGLAAVACALLDEGAVNRLVTTGGDTSCAIMNQDGIAAMQVDGAIAPGIPLVTTCDGPRRHIITKAGGFGTPEALIRSMAFLVEGRLPA